MFCNTQISAVVQEELEKAKRESSVVVRGLPVEWKGEERELQQKCCELFECSASDVASFEFMSTPKSQSGNTGASSASASSSPVRIKFHSISTKIKIYRKRFNLKVNGKAIYVNHDLTKRQQAERRENLSTYKALRAKKVTCSMPYGTILDRDQNPLDKKQIKEILGEQSDQ